jgi:hypothetical protein
LVVVVVCQNKLLASGYMMLTKKWLKIVNH